MFKPAEPALFYLLAPLVYTVVSRGAWSHAVLLAGLTIVGLFILFERPGQFTPAFIFVSWPYFALGWWLSKTRHQVLQPRQSRWMLLMLLAVIVGAALTYANDIRAAAVSIILAIVMISLSCGQLDRLAPFRWAREGLENRWLVRLGSQSYSLYLLHVLILDAVGALLLRAGAFGSSHLWNFLWLSSLTAALAVAVSAVTYRWIEAPFFQRRA